MTFEQRLRELTERYRESLPDQIGKVRSLLREAVVAKTGAAALNEAIRLCHNLAGASATYGFGETSQVARKIEQALITCQRENRLPDEETFAETLAQLESSVEKNQPVTLPKEWNHSALATIFVLTTDTECISKLKSQLAIRQINVRHFISQEVMLEAYQANPSAICLFVDLDGEGSTPNIDLLKRIHQHLPRLPLVAFSSKDGFNTRLATVRANAQTFICKPLVVDKVFSALESISQPADERNLRVLIVDDDEATALFYAYSLMKNEIEAEALSDPSQLIDKLESFHPDVVVMDLYQGPYHGVELAKIVRQIPGFDQIPIIYLSLEDKLEDQLKAIQEAGDAFLTKPIGVNHLILAIHAHSKRARSVKRSRKYLRHASAELQHLKQTLDAHAIVSVTDADGIITQTNKTFCDISGYSEEELIGKTHNVVNSGHHDRAFFDDMWQTIRAGKIWQGQVCNRAKSGEIYWVNSTIVPFLDNHGHPYKYVSARTDITHLKRAEQTIKQKSDDLEVLLNAMPAQVWFQDVSSNIIRANATAQQFVGCSEMELIGKPMHEVFPFEAETFEAEDKQVIITGNPLIGRIHQVTLSNQSSHYLRIDRIPYFGASNKVTGVIVFAVDISELINTQEALRESQERFRRSQVFANIGTWDWHIESGEIFWSEQVAPLLGYQRNEIKSTYDNFIKAIHRDDRQAMQRALKACIEGGTPYDIEHRVLWRDGSVHWLHQKGDVVRDEAGKPLHMLGVVQDISHRKLLAEKLARQQKLVSTLNAVVTKFILSASLADAASSMTTSVLDMTESALGLGAELIEVDGLPQLRVMSVARRVETQDGSYVYEPQNIDNMRFEDLQSSLVGKVALEGRTIFSNNYPDEQNIGPLPKDHVEIENFVGIPILYGDDTLGVYVLANRKGGFDESLIELLRPFSATYGVLISAQRMKEQEQRSQQALIAAKEEAERANKAKSEFLSSMSHELRTPLNAILGFAKLLEIDQEEQLSRNQMESIREIEKAGEHLLELINEVLDLARIESGRLSLSNENVDVTLVLNECEALITPLATEHGITIHWCEVDGPDINVFADRTRLKQILLNLLSNAIKYNRQDGEVWLKITHNEDNTHACFEVKDTGKGFDQDAMTHLFEAFNRLSAEGSGIEGTGIGLVITKRLVELMHGTLTVESEKEQGSSFRFCLPFAKPQLALVAGTDDNGEKKVSNGTEPVYKILYIEDNPASLKLIQQIFRRKKEFALIGAEHPHFGLDLARTHRPDVILLDFNLPDMNGLEVIDKLKEMKETDNIPIVILSANVAVHRDLEKREYTGLITHVSKPVNSEELLATLDKALKE